ncbi:hypothetical protein OEZ85_003746 [Tetradesmus obliquus]|uniref:Uncharacterized protein n=1 Tax=Tetradesmus obliquus TaxID=3088 RepID=A0ABY8UHJ3_TETOB|nr:hypothetical protein OEZ85_003746 [Tetradesmus obliquus]
MLLFGVLQLASLQAAPAAVAGAASRHVLLRGMPTGSSRRQLQGATAEFLTVKVPNMPSKRSGTLEAGSSVTSSLQADSAQANQAKDSGGAAGDFPINMAWWHKKKALKAKKQQQLPSTAVLVGSPSAPVMGRPVADDSLPDVTYYNHPVWKL